MTKGNNTPEEKTAAASLERQLREMKAVHAISNALHSSDDLEAVIRKVMQVLHEQLGMERGTLTLLDFKTGDLLIQEAYGLDRREIERGRYRVGEGITGKVVQAGEPIVVPNVGDEPLFLNRTGARGDIKRSNIAFICVPIKLDSKTIGALSVDRLFQENISLDEDVRLLNAIALMVTQTVRNYQKRLIEREKLESENQRLRRELQKKFHPENIVGESKRMWDVYASIELVGQTKATVMLRGESGTGKELVAHAIHYSSDRSDGPFIKVSCAALPDTLLESELFGYEKGAFTGAVSSKKGRFEMAHEGTLFLDEIGDISPSTQVKLLRILQEKEFERLGGTQTLRVDIRLITATNKDLEKEVREGRFREDLYYRLNVVPIFLPALRERKEDIPLLVNHFLEKAAKENNKKALYVADHAMDFLMNYSWPGNVRELENVIERAVVLCKNDTLTQELFPIPGTKTNPVLATFNPPEVYSSLDDDDNSILMPEAVKRLEKKMIERAMSKTGRNQRKAAKILGITERMLGYKLRRYGLKAR